MNMKKVNLKVAYDKWYYTIVGVGGDPQEWMDGYEKLMAEEGIGTPSCWYYCKGSDINRKFSLKGENKFKSDWLFLFFPLDGLPLSRLAVYKIAMHDHWFTDIINNRACRE